MTVGRFLVVGAACALLHNAILVAGDAFGLHYAVSSVISLFVVSAFGYWLHSRWTYPDAERGRAPFARYLVAVGANFPLSLAGLFVLVDLIGIGVPIAAPVVTVILLLFNYLANRWALGAGRSRA